MRIRGNWQQFKIVLFSLFLPVLFSENIQVYVKKLLDQIWCMASLTNDEGKDENVTSYPHLPTAKGKETVMMIIRLGIFLPLTFPSDFPDSRHRKGMRVCVLLCVRVSRWCNSTFSQESRQWCSWHQLICYGRFVIVHDISPSFPLSTLSLVILGHLLSIWFPLWFKNIIPFYLYPPYPHVKATLARWGFFCLTYVSPALVSPVDN